MGAILQRKMIWPGVSNDSSNVDLIAEKNFALYDNSSSMETSWTNILGKNATGVTLIDGNEINSRLAIIPKSLNDTDIVTIKTNFFLAANSLLGDSEKLPWGTPSKLFNNLPVFLEKQAFQYAVSDLRNGITMPQVTSTEDLNRGHYPHLKVMIDDSNLVLCTTEAKSTLGAEVPGSSGYAKAAYVIDSVKLTRSNFVLKTVNDRISSTISVPLEKVLHGVSINFTGVIIQKNDGSGQTTVDPDMMKYMDALINPIKIPKSDFIAGKRTQFGDGTTDGIFNSHHSVSVEIHDNQIIFFSDSTQNSSLILTQWGADAIATEFYLKVGNITAY
ncbi:hypothetical protein GPK34_02140 [Secundilactobacillus kimchicus]|uniref:hypothetical protein n=1 Tax=Secundilactobacillus kimchicus TaxID=528209 RepID=UPI001C01F01F|nr:hypothetical protein [Secundilactobacillus kimchicus]MBT9670838.1 hypothetical protein [Secundilactobacillus kimchicus]